MKTNLTVAMAASVLAAQFGIPQASAQNREGLVQQIHEYSKRAGCGQMSEHDAAEFANAASSKKLDVEKFKKLYNVSCGFRASMEAVKDEALAEIFEKVLRMSKAPGRCKGLTGSQALQVAQAALKGEIQVHHFAVAYYASCEFEGPFTVAHMLTVAPMVEGKVQDLREVEREEAHQEVKPSQEDEELKERWIQIESKSAAGQSVK